MNVIMPSTSAVIEAIEVDDGKTKEKLIAAVVFTADDQAKLAGAKSKPISANTIVFSWPGLIWGDDTLRLPAC